MRVSPSAYYSYRRGESRRLSPPKAAITALIKAEFYRQRRRYGVRRLAAEMQAQGARVGRQRVRTVMRREGLRAIGSRRFTPRTTDSSGPQQASPNLLREATNNARRPGQVIVGDITYLPLASGGWGYLASWQDQFSKRIVGWSVAERMTEDLVIEALGKAIRGGWIGSGAIIHRDRGSQYASQNFRALLRHQGYRQSMSRRGNCWDNAQAESFFARYKAELLEGGIFESIAQARGETFSYIEGYYNSSS